MSEHLETRFLTTPWTLLLQRGDTTNDRPSRALVKLCESYRYPIYAFIRRRCSDPEQAGDHCQSFFAYLIEKKIYQKATPERGKFRTFLLASAKNFLSNKHRDAHTLKRGGGTTHISLDTDDAETIYAAQLPDESTSPEVLFDRGWANSVFDKVWCILQAEFEKRDQLDRFEALRPCLMTPEDALAYAEIGQQIGLSETAVKSAVTRLRERFRDLFRSSVAQLVENPNEVDEEIAYLMEVMAHSQT